MTSAAQPAKSTAGGQQPCATGRILVVDDTDMNRDVLARRLQREGYDVVAARDGREALRLIADQEFDLVVLDVMMPEISGLEVLRQVRETRSMQSLPVIMATGLSESEDVVEGLRGGANDYVTKPLNFPVLQARIATQLDLKRMADEIKLLNRRMKQGLESAALVQRAGLPVEEPENSPFHFAWRFLPCDELAGDGIAIVPVSERWTVVALWDVSGHGVPASLLSVAISHTLGMRAGSNSIIRNRDGAPAAPGAVATRLNGIFPMICSHNLHFTMCYGVLDSEQRTFSFTSAGHPPPLHLGAGGDLAELSLTGFPIGVVNEELLASRGKREPPVPGNGELFRELSIELQPGDRVYLYSDGLIEQPDGEGEFFGMPRFRQCLIDNAAVDMNQSLENLVAALESWRGDEEFKDDVSVLAIELD
jgi:sigma-B regulation protein RsbU (phosphoserine phosphatase)